MGRILLRAKITVHFFSQSLLSQGYNRTYADCASSPSTVPRWRIASPTDGFRKVALNSFEPDWCVTHIAISTTQSTYLIPPAWQVQGTRRKKRTCRTSPLNEVTFPEAVAHPLHGHAPHWASNPPWTKVSIKYVPIAGHVPLLSTAIHWATYQWISNISILHDPIHCATIQWISDIALLPDPIHCTIGQWVGNNPKLPKAIRWAIAQQIARLFIYQTNDTRSCSHRCRM
jgi:hypothetical protein